MLVERFVFYRNLRLESCCYTGRVSGTCLVKMIVKNISASTQTKPLLLNVSNTVLHVTADEFDSLCLDNPDLRLELTKDQELIVIS